jgi:hypothetical protein
MTQPEPGVTVREIEAAGEEPEIVEAVSSAPADQPSSLIHGR